MNKAFISLALLALTLLSGCGGGTSDTAQTQIASDIPQTEITPRTENTAFTSTHFSGSQNCATCHNGIKDVANKDVSIESDWAGTMMANSSKDPLWQAKVASELKRNPHLEDVINDKCTKCHAPMANYEAHHIQETPKLFDDGFLNPQNQHFDAAMNGVSCSLCHQIDATNLGTLDGFSGHYTINQNREIYGQYTGVNTTPMLNNVNYTPMYAQHISESKMCASCHNLKTPFVDANGNLLTTTLESEFPEQMPYSEWEHSEFASTNAKSCQECHMQRADGVVISNRPNNGLAIRDNFKRHNFVGANILMLDILNQNKTALGVNPNANFEKILTQTQELRKTTATLALSSSKNAETLSVAVDITSNAGHKLPTSFPSRRVFVHFTLFDTNNNILFESGKVNADGSIVGADGDANASSFEPHFNVINAENQVQIYEAVMQNSDNKVTHTLLRAASYVKDNRLLPRGFNKVTAPSDIAVVGDANTSDANFIGGSDRVTYELNTTAFGSKTPARAEVELLYQTLSYPFAKDLFDDNTTESRIFEGMFDASEMKSTKITQQNLVLY